nr:MAG TPA: hypothetical protein [Caudoviricetes sp.]
MTLYLRSFHAHILNAKISYGLPEIIMLKEDTVTKKTVNW